MSDMHIEENRLQTFATWPNDVPVEPGRIAKAGFYATGNSLEVQCHWCTKKITYWDYGDQAMARHRRLNPLCSFLTNPTACGNVPITIAVSTPPTPTVETIPSSLQSMKNEQCRIDSYTNWPVSFIAPETLAKAGFYYYNQEDRVKCAWCKGIVGQWETGDNPFLVHQRFFPTCPRALLGPNIEIGDGDGINELVIQQIRPPRMVKYSSLDSRMRTFSQWPVPDIQKPVVLAQAGFYYQGVHDQVRCFHCDGGLKYWLKEDDPWCEHARWFPKCQFVQLVKGQQYIENIQKSTTNNETNQERRQNPIVTLEQAMSSEPVRQALEMGLHEGRIRAATKHHLEHRGYPFRTADDLVRAVIEGQVYDEEDDDDDDQSSESNIITRGVSRLVDILLNTSQQQNASNHNENLTREQDYTIATAATTTTITYSQNQNRIVQQTPILENIVPEKKLINSMQIASTSSAADNVEHEESKMSLEEENRKLKDARLCKICMDDEVGIVFLPCGHLVTCGQCAPGVSSCPLCRADIKGYVRTFLS